MYQCRERIKSLELLQVCFSISENIHFVKEDKARDWILSSDYIVSNYSTTLIEASLANKKTYMLEPYEFPEYMVNEWYKYIPKINNYKDLNSIDKENSLQPYQVNRELIKKARKDAVFMHCLPAHRGKEVTNEVIDSNQSIVFAGAENRLHIQRSIIWWCLKK